MWNLVTIKNGLKENINVLVIRHFSIDMTVQGFCGTIIVIKFWQIQFDLGMVIARINALQFIDFIWYYQIDSHCIL